MSAQSHIQRPPPNPTPASSPALGDPPYPSSDNICCHAESESEEEDEEEDESGWQEVMRLEGKLDEVVPGGPQSSLTNPEDPDDEGVAEEDYVEGVSPARPTRPGPSARTWRGRHQAHRTLHDGTSRLPPSTTHAAFSPRSTKEIAEAVAGESFHAGVKVQQLGTTFKALADGSQGMEKQLAKHLEVHDFEWARKIRRKLKAFRTVEEKNGNVDRTAMERDIAKVWRAGGGGREVCRTEEVMALTRPRLRRTYRPHAPPR